ncbi:hypothetical protein BH18ACI4_BH18ACI4_20780 [soil metagenome]
MSPDLREMIQDGKAASGKDRVTVILQADDVKSGPYTALLKRNGIRVLSRLGQLGMLEVEMPISAIEKLAANSATRYVSLNRDTYTLGHVETTTGASLVRSQTILWGGYTFNYTLNGKDVGIAILDSGIYTAHHEFLGSNDDSRVAVSVDFTGENRTNDPYGHGTHVAGLAAGNAHVSNGAYTGTAPSAKLINLRVLNSQGAGSVSSLLTALDWVLANRALHKIKVVNMSLGTPAIDSYKNDPLCRSVRKLVDAGVVVVAAAGNDGKDSEGQKLYGNPR